MNNDEPKKQAMKISPQFRMRLHQLDPGQKVQAIVFLQTADTPRTTYLRPRASRKTLLKSVRQTAAKALPEIDEVLARYDGKRLSKTPDALGAVLVETTAEGITALADMDAVKTILENQSISALSNFRQA